MKKNKNAKFAVEEFLVAAGEKESVTLSAKSDKVSLNANETAWMQEVIVKKSTWGYKAFNVVSKSEFISLNTSGFTTEDFVDDLFAISFTCDPGFIKNGMNYGQIVVESLSERLEIPIELVSGSDEEISNTKKEIAIQKLYLDALGLYVSYNSAGMDDNTYLRSLTNIYDECQKLGIDSSYTKEMCKGYKGFLKIFVLYVELIFAKRKGMKEKADKIISEYSRLQNELFDLNMDAFACINFLLMDYYDEREKKLISAGNVLKCLKSDSHSMLIPCMIIIGRIDYNDKEKLLKELLEWIRMGENSPLIFLSACKLLNENNGLFEDLNEGVVACLHWGVKTGYLNMSVSERYAYFVEYKREFNELIFNDMCTLFELYKSDDYLKAICAVLLNGHKTSNKYHNWYALGIERNIRLTGLHEYYIYTLHIDEDTKYISDEILEYFLYDTSLKMNKKAALFSYIIRHKAVDRKNFSAYDDKMRRFAFEQLSSMNVNRELADVYDEYITNETIDREVAGLLSRVMFSYELVCYDMDIVGVIVRHPQIENEEQIPLVRGRALVQLYSENSVILLVDVHGNRFATSVKYSLNKLMQVDRFLNKCFEYQKKDPGLVISLYERRAANAKSAEFSSEIRRRLYSLKGLSKRYKKKLYPQIIKDCYEAGETSELNKLLKNLNWKNIDMQDSSSVIETCINSGYPESAYEGIKKFGFEKVDAKSLLMVSAEKFAKTNVKEEQFLNKLSLHLFRKGKFDNNILSYMCNYVFYGLEDMVQLARISSNNGINDEEVAELEERIITNSITTGEVIEELSDLYIDYSESDRANRTIERAFLNFISYRYFIKERMLPNKLVKYVAANSISQDSVCCKLAYLKFLSEKESLSEDEKEYVSYHVDNLWKKNVYFAFFKRFSDKADISYEILQYTYIEYVADPDDIINIRCKISDSHGNAKENVELMKDVFEGRRVKKCVLFCGEKIEYEILDLTDKGDVLPEIGGADKDVLMQDAKVLSKGEYQYRILNDNKTGMFSEINDIIQYYDKGNRSAFINSLNRYVLKRSITESFKKMWEEMP